MAGSSVESVYGTLGVIITLFYTQQQRIYMKTTSYRMLACSLLFFASIMRAGVTDRGWMKALIREDFVTHGLENFDLVTDAAQKVVDIYGQENVSSDDKQKQLQQAIQECRKSYLQSSRATLKAEALKTTLILKRLQGLEQFFGVLDATPRTIQQNDFPYHIRGNGIIQGSSGRYRNT